MEVDLDITEVGVGVVFGEGWIDEGLDVRLRNREEEEKHNLVGQRSPSEARGSKEGTELTSDIRVVRMAITDILPLHKSVV